MSAADAIAIGSSTFYYNDTAIMILPPMEKFIENLGNAGVKGKIGAAFGSYGWSGEAPVMIADKMRGNGMIVIEPVLRIQYQPTEKTLRSVRGWERISHRR